MPPVPRQATEFRQAAQRHIHFAGRSAVFVAAHFVDEFRRQVLLVHQFQKRQIGIDARRNHRRLNFLSGAQRDSRGSAVFQS
jgi:hypothetical protein